MAAILSAVTDVVTASIGWMGDFLSVITATNSEGQFTNPILLLFVIIPLVGLGIGLLKRLMNL